MPPKNDLIQQWEKDEKAPFAGWDFSYLQGRQTEKEPPWQYTAIAKRLIKRSKAVLDMATGGGEIFSQILSAGKPRKIIATEGYRPNVSVAAKNLNKFGVKVVYADETKKLPFKKASFDLVLNRHGGFNVKELSRIISPRGYFLTQQVDGRDLLDLMREFKALPKWPHHTLVNVKKQLRGAGFSIKKAEKWNSQTIFKDVGALVYFLKAIPWIVDGFNVKKYLRVLEKLQKRLQKTGKLIFASKRFLILAKRKFLLRQITNKKRIFIA